MTNAPAPQFTPTKAPIAHKKQYITHVHGVALSDDYAWLRADNWKQVLQDGSTLPEPIKKHLKLENRYTQNVLQNTKPLQEQLLNELKSRIKENDSSVPLQDGKYAYFTRYKKDSEHPIFCRTTQNGETQILLDGNAVANRHTFCDIGAAIHSPDHTLLAWSNDTEGSEFYTIYVKNAVSLRNKRDKIEMTDGSIVWAKDSKSFYYVRIDEGHRPHSVCRHFVGSTQPDETIYVEQDQDYFIDLTRSQSSDYALINVSGHTSSQELLVDLVGNNSPQLVAQRRNDVLYESEHNEAQLFILTNADNAIDFKIVTAPLSNPAQWSDYIAHKQGVMIVSLCVLKNHLIWLEYENASPRIIVHRLSDKAQHSIEFDDEAFDLDLTHGFEFDTQTIQFVYSTMAKPQETYAYNLETRTKTLLKRVEIPNGHNPAHYVTKRIFAKAHDGEMIPISLLYKKGVALNGTAPCLLYAYGAYGYASPPLFESEPLSLVDRGFIYAIAHVRGGTEKGRMWYERGKLAHKNNTFTDYIACAKHLCEQNFTRQGLIVAQGVSAGGMLMGAIANMAPELFAGIVAEVPFVDVLNTILDGDLPLTPPEWPEWGNPVTDIQAFETIRSYSPYDNITRQNYPAILALGGLCDPRVTYWEPAKWVAKLREYSKGDAPVLLRTNMNSGHGGASGRFERLEDIALVYAFALTAVNALK